MKISNLRVVEIVGPAGAGKSTLYQALRGRDNLHLDNFPDVRRLANLPFFLWNGARVIGSLRRLGGLSRRELAWMAILRGWPVLLQKSDSRVTVLDQGPVYLLTELREFGPASLRTSAADSLWRDLSARWSHTLDLIVWLDADDADLLERIRSREKAHIVKGASDEETLSFLNRYRAAYERVMADLHAPILRFNSSRMTTTQIVENLMRELGDAR